MYYSYALQSSPSGNLIVPDKIQNKKETTLEFKTSPKNETVKLNEKKVNATQPLIKAEENKIKNIEVEVPAEFKNNFDNDKIISQAARRINAIYPMDDINPLNTYPGYRGTNQLVIYTNDFAKTTGTNEYGKEAVVKHGMVVALTGANSTIPRDGYVISGHGTAKKWITENLKIGTKVEIEDRTLNAYTTLDSFRYCAKEKIDYVQDMLTSSRFDSSAKNDKTVYNYLKRAKQQYRKS